ncbi:hypothetical protein [Limimaricola litoreus]|uniref:Uncharacterized protein n=1 Tax=Limimaricola litoreus TaxID=2955316 RepID=A0A9X2JPY7_9RHOB|nr:hypothetical protein [Limimaricola litoreus]MCP1169379.1 hypothetical protein [Limimaricola litoreus]
MDKVSNLVAEALGYARVVRKCLDGKIIPLLEPRHRSFASEISRRIGTRSLMTEGFLRDLEAFIALLNEQADGETSYVWRGHEHDPDCGYTVPVRSERAAVFITVLDAVGDLATAIEAALDAAEAYRIANTLFEQT